MNKMFKKLRIAAYALGNALNIPLVGQLKGSEVIVLLSAPFTFKLRDFKDYPYFRKIIFALIALLVFQCITDVLVVHTSMQDFLRGWAGTIMSMVSFLVLFRIMDTEEAVMTYIFWAMIKNILFTDDIVDSDMSFFKFKVVPIIASALQLISVYLYKRGKLTQLMIIMAVACLFCFAHDARSSGMLFFVGAGIIWIMGRGIRITRQKLFAILIIGAVAFETAYVFYVNAVLSNEIGGGHSSAQLKRLDNPYNPFELLMTGRGETFAAVTAISDKPLFGHGSWAKDKDLKYYKIVLSYQDEEEFDLKKADSVDRYIPSHSILMGGWISCGLGGFIAVFLIFWYLCKMGFTLVLKGQDLPLYPLYVMLTITMVWTFLFSPFQHLRFTIPVVGCILMNGYYDWLYGPNTDEAEDDGEPADVEEEHVMLN
ncbi:MAG TPA: hypothetical protein VFS25_15410 [Chitinophaga sp.]|uniref:hypothetical protein n=1 Tax=Chitinophaga sp. TaxID=1869181 RepID=UPI002DB5C54F|nr:hypothetical protein [Chitinophaga sp.]HEU4554232.1 hypothetical protein [Chitinophaga sp.]